jgi:hypothetical protein
MAFTYFSFPKSKFQLPPWFMDAIESLLHNNTISALETIIAFVLLAIASTSECGLREHVLVKYNPPEGY